MVQAWTLATPWIVVGFVALVVIAGAASGVLGPRFAGSRAPLPTVARKRSPMTLRAGSLIP